jgi:fatty-acyl-CoA synthase
VSASWQTDIITSPIVIAVAGCGWGWAIGHRIMVRRVTSPLHDLPLLPHLVIQSLNAPDDTPCIHIAGRVATYGEIRRRTSQMAQAQRSRGVGRGTRLAVLSKNRPEVLTNVTASLVNGCVLTPLHPMGSLADHAYAIEDAEIECLVFDATYFSERASELKVQFPHLTLLGFGPNDVGDDYLALADQFEPQPLVAPDVHPDDLCTVVYTGGTTGRPKGVLMTHRVWAAMTWIQMTEWEFPTDLRIAIATPLSHAALSLVAPVLLSRGAFYVMDGVTPDGFFDLVAEHRITATMLVPVMLYALQAHPRYTTADMSSMETIFYGASPMSPTKLAQAIEQWGPIFFQFYGQTEAPMVLTHLKKGEHDPAHSDRLASCGRPVPWMHLALLDSNNERVGPGESGEICVRGPLVMNGYKDMPDETAVALSGDWLHTGDVGRLDDEGYVYIVDRTKDMVITGGFNVFPREVEDVISTHPAVSMVMVVGVPDEKWGEAVKAVVVLQPGHAPSDSLTRELQQLVKDAKGSQQSPKSIDYVDSLPLTPVGKPDKKAVRATYWGAADRAVS